MAQARAGGTDEAQRWPYCKKHGQMPPAGPGPSGQGLEELPVICGKLAH